MENKAKILIVDDLPKNIQLLGSILRDKGYDIAFAKNGAEAIQRVENYYFDLILLDIMMPEINGFEVCQHLKKNKNTSSIPIIFLTAKNDTESTVKGFKLGAVDYVTKPFNAIELIARVETHLALKKSSEEIRRSNIKLKELNSTKDKFFSILAHDLRNPLISFKGITELLINNYKDFTEEERIEFINSMKNSAKHLFELFDNLLEWSRMQTGRINFNPISFNSKPLIAKAISILEANSTNKKINLIDNTDKHYIFGDKDMFSSIFRNLLSNAIKFSYTNSEIIITSSDHKSHIQFDVTDHGIGIGEDELSKLFRIDEHVSKKGTIEENGSGLGLILCKEFTSKNNGKIWVKSKTNEGSTFSFTFPSSMK